MTTCFSFNTPVIKINCATNMIRQHDYIVPHSHVGLLYIHPFSHIIPPTLQIDVQRTAVEPKVPTSTSGLTAEWHNLLKIDTLRATLYKRMIRAFLDPTAKPPVRFCSPWYVLYVFIKLCRNATKPLTKVEPVSLTTVCCTSNLRFEVQYIVQMGVRLLSLFLECWSGVQILLRR